METVELHFFHGFLGLPEDWDSVIDELSVDKSVEIHKHNLWDDLNDVANVSFESWAKLKNQKFGNSLNKKIGVGYSLGGRLLMHLNAQHFSQLVFIASHPGLLDLSERKRRLGNDLDWGEQFVSLGWEELMSLWNAQDIFSADKVRPERKEELFDREKLSLSLQSFSLSQQEPKDGYLASIKDKVLWACGERDTKFLSLKTRLSLLIGEENVQMIEQSGHGCLFNQPKSVAELIKGVF